MLFVAAATGLLVQDALRLPGLALRAAAPFRVRANGTDLAYVDACRAAFFLGEAQTLLVNEGVKLPRGAELSAVDATAQLAADGRRQWRLFFDNELGRLPPAWLSRCGGALGLGGHCVPAARGFNLTLELPPHGLLRLAFTLSLLDLWQGETFFVAAVEAGRVAQYLYTESADTKDIAGGADVCGAPFKDAVVGRRAEVVFEWPARSLQLFFSSTLAEDPCLASFFLAEVQLSLL